MLAAEMEVIKDIPCYRVVLQAVIKYQIQQLMSQLSEHTEEESVILSANSSDGTVTYQGTALGETFLQAHTDFKSKFLNFCNKKHKKQDQPSNKTSSQQSDADDDDSDNLPKMDVSDTRISTHEQPGLEVEVKSEPGTSALEETSPTASSRSLPPQLTIHTSEPAMASTSLTGPVSNIPHTSPSFISVPRLSPFHLDEASVTQCTKTSQSAVATCNTSPQSSEVRPVKLFRVFDVKSALKLAGNRFQPYTKVKPLPPSPMKTQTVTSLPSAGITKTPSSLSVIKFPPKSTNQHQAQETALSGLQNRAKFIVQVPDEMCQSTGQYNVKESVVSVTQGTSNVQIMPVRGPYNLKESVVSASQGKSNVQIMSVRASANQSSEANSRSLLPAQLTQQNKSKEPVLSDKQEKSRLHIVSATGSARKGDHSQGLGPTSKPPTYTEPVVRVKQEPPDISESFNPEAVISNKSSSSVNHVEKQNTDRSLLNIGSEEEVIPNMPENGDNQTVSEMEGNKNVSEKGDNSMVSEKGGNPNVSETEDNQVVSEKKDSPTVSEKRDNPVMSILSEKGDNLIVSEKGGTLLSQGELDSEKGIVAGTSKDSSGCVNDSVTDMIMNQCIGANYTQVTPRTNRKRKAKTKCESFLNELGKKEMASKRPETWLDEISENGTTNPSGDKLIDKKTKESGDDKIKQESKNGIPNTGKDEISQIYQSVLKQSKKTVNRHGIAKWSKNTAPVKGTRISKTLTFKYNAIMEVEKGEKSQVQIARDLKVKQNSLSTWIKKAALIKEDYKNFSPRRMRMKKCKWIEIEQVLLQWIHSASENNELISMPVLIEMALKYADSRGISDFTGNRSWFERFISRYDINLGT